MSRVPSLLLLALSVGLAAASGCGKREIDPSLQPLVDEFMSEGTKRGVSVTGWKGSAQLVDHLDDVDGKHPTGVCHQRSIEIERGQFEKLGPFRKRALVFHELGHCVLDREHDEKTGEILVERILGGEPWIEESRIVPASIMIPVWSGTETELAELWSAYVDELFIHRSVFEAVSASPARVSQIRGRWSQMLSPAVERFATEARRFDATIGELALTFDSTISDEGSSAHGRRRTVAAGRLAQAVAKLGRERSDPCVEMVVFAALSETLLPHVNHTLEIETRDGKAYPRSLRMVRQALANPDFPAYYSAHRDQYVRELFTGRWEEPAPTPSPSPTPSPAVAEGLPAL